MDQASAGPHLESGSMAPERPELGKSEVRYINITNRKNQAENAEILILEVRIATV